MGQMDELTILLLCIAGSVLAITVVLEIFLIRFFRAHRVGQKILEIGPNWHKEKEGTPFMGGLGFIFAGLLVMAIFFVIHAFKGDSARYVPLSLTLTFATANGVIGFIDDYCKFRKKRNEGLTRNQKTVLQFVIAAAYVCVMSYTGNMTTLVHIPFTSVSINLGWLFYPIAIFVLYSVVNGTNLTDGVDGLAGSVTLVIGVFFVACGYAFSMEQIAILGALLVGGCFGFLLFNFHPARIFMGDTGSLFLGAMVIGTAFQMQEELVGVLISLVFLIELLSSFLQIFCYKMFNKMRLFRMAPLHHHFEKCGWNEYAIVFVFSLFEALFCILAWFAI